MFNTEQINALRNIHAMNGSACTELLEKNREFELIEKVQIQDDRIALEELLLKHRPFIKKIAEMYFYPSYHNDDVINVANMALIESIGKFDHEKGVRLNSFAVMSIRYAVKKFVMDNFRQYKIFTTKSDVKVFSNIHKWKKAHGVCTDELPQSVAEKIADETGIEASRILEINTVIFLERNKGIYAPVESLGDTQFIDTLPSEGLSPEELLSNEECVHGNKAQLKYALQHYLKDRERDIVTSRWLCSPQATLQELADKYGVSAERIRQIEKNALKKLQAHITIQ